MSINFISSFIFIITFFGGIYIGVRFIKIFSDDILNKLEVSFDDQLKVSIDFYNKSLKKHVDSMNNKLIFQDKINDNFKTISDYLSQTSIKINNLNIDCDVRKELEHEIIKLKNIIKRLEK